MGGRSKSLMVAPILQSALAALGDASDRFDRSAAQVTRLASAPSFAKDAASVNISAAGRAASTTAAAHTVESRGSLERSLLDTRLAKYAFVANLKVVQVGDDVAGDLNKLGGKS
jgi:hypothetical protein